MEDEDDAKPLLAMVDAAETADERGGGGRGGGVVFIEDVLAEEDIEGEAEWLRAVGVGGGGSRTVRPEPCRLTVDTLDSIDEASGTTPVKKIILEHICIKTF